MHRLNFLSSNGEVGKLIHEKDWSNNPLGEPQSWPQSLKTALSIILNSKFPNFIFWGDELRCFYNDAYRPSLGIEGKHPGIIGEKGEDAWPEIWNLIKPMMDQVLQTGEATWSENQLIPFYRNGRLEEIYWTFSYSPIVDEQGKVAGIFTACVETTLEVKTRIELERKNKEYFQNIMQAPVAMSILKGSEFTVEIANQLMLVLWGKSSEDVYNKPIFEGLPEAKNQGLEELLEEVYQTGTRFEAKGRLITLPRAGKLQDFYIDFVYEPVKNSQNKVTSILIIASDVTSSVLAMQKIQESEERFRKVADQAPVLIWMSGTDKLCYYFNKAWLQFTGRTMEEEDGNGWAEGVHPDDLERCITVYTTAFDKREEFYMEYRLKRHDGEYRWLSDNGTPRFTADGIFEGFIGACMDINDTVTASRILKENEEKLNIVIDATELGVWEYNYKLGDGTFDAQYAAIFGYADPAKLTSAMIEKHMFAGDSHVRDKAHSAVLESGQLNYESRIVWNDGSIHWIEVNGKLFKDADGLPEKVMGTIRDITRDKKYEQDLVEREEKFRLLADEMPQFVWTADANGKLTYFNESLYKYTGYVPDSANDDKWIEFIHPDEREHNFKAWMDAVTSGTDYLFENRFKRYDGVYRWQLSRGKPLKDSNGKITMWVGTSTDIQEIKELEEQKDYFISMASHELKTPITSIKGYIQLLESKYRNTEDAFLKNSLKVVHKQIETLTTLVSDLLDVSKIKTGSLQLRKSNFNINSLLSDVIVEIQHINPQNEISLQAEEDIIAFADEESIRQVIINFLTNAVKYSPNARKVLVNLKKSMNELTVAVTDAGIGISEDNQAKIFERFYRVEGKNEKTFPGFGIGLYIAAEIVRKHNGKIGVSSEVGKGSTFYFTLPL
ncbi:MAG TPA: PAS domain S-box protein [Pelobium sp.]